MPPSLGMIDYSQIILPYYSWEVNFVSTLKFIKSLISMIMWYVFLADCRYNREGEQRIAVTQGEDDEEEEEEAEDEAVSGASLSSHRSSLVDEAPEDAEFEQKISRLMAAKQKLRQLQDVVAMVQVNTVWFFGKLSSSIVL